MASIKPSLTFVFIASLSISLSGCSETKTSTTVDNPDGTQTTTVVEKKLLQEKTTVTTTQKPGADSDRVNIQIGEDQDGVNKVKVRAPGIRIDGNDKDDNVDVNLPFVKVKKDGGKVHVKAPFVDIDANAH